MTKVIELTRVGLKAFSIFRESTAPAQPRSLSMPWFPDPDATDLWENSAVAACLSTAMDAIVEAPLFLYELTGTDEDGEEIWEKRPAHPISRLLDQPNPYYTGAELRQATLLSRMVDGNGYNVIVENRRYAQPAEIWYEPHYCIEPKWDERDPTSFITHYERRDQQFGSKLEPVNVIHMRWGLDPRNTRKGLAPLKSFARGVKGDDELDVMTYAIVRKKDMPGLIVMPKFDTDEFNEETREEIEQTIAAKVGGGNKGGTLVTSRPVEIASPNISPKDMDTSGMGRRAEERISGILNTPAILAGLGAGLERSTFANMEEAQRYFSERFLIQRWRQEGQAYTRSLVPRFGLSLDRFKVAADVTQVKALQDNREQLHKIADGSFNAGWLDRAGAKKLAKFGKIDPEDKGVYKSPGASPDEEAAKKLKEDLGKTYASRRLIFEAMQTEFDADTEETH